MTPLRLHLNEHTGGCSPRVVDALATLTAADFAAYPDYGEVYRDVAAFFGVPEAWVLLANGLDEGLDLVSRAALGWGAPAAPNGRRTRRTGRRGGSPEAVIVEPTFEMYARCAAAAGGRVRSVPPRSDFAFPLDRVLAVIGPRTRLVFLCTPNNPTGQLVARDEIVAVARAAPGALVLVDEAYAEFAGRSLIGPRGLEAPPNVVVGRTFAKAFGLAGLRAGALVARPETLDRVRRLAPPYSLNVCAATALRAALQDREHLARTVEEARASKRLLYAACDRLGLRYWPSEANFVLVRVGDRAAELVDALARRGILVRDRSREPGCAGCLRITTGPVAHTRAAIAALEALLCGAWS